jgi:peroxiredoxin Q/BCP
MHSESILVCQYLIAYPGTNQVCLFRDAYTDLTKEGLAIYGLSTDSPKANTTFKTKQNLQYPLLCDPSATLIGAIGLKKTPKGTTRGVFAVDKTGKVLVAEPGGPAATVDAVKKLVAAGGFSAAKPEAVVDKPTNAQVAEEKKAAEAVEKPAE